MPGMMRSIPANISSASVSARRTMRMVSSPAIVPIILWDNALSMTEATMFAYPGLVFKTPACPENSMLLIPEMMCDASWAR